MKSLNTAFPIFPLLNKSYPTKPEPSALLTKPSLPDEDTKSVGIMARKVTDLLCVHKSLDPGELFSLLEFAEYEITSVNYLSVPMQGMVYDKRRFLTASKC